MTSDFESLAEKIAQLAELMAVLRRENAELRVRNAELISEQGLVSERLQQARERVNALIGSLPLSPAPVAVEEKEAGE